MNGCNVFLFIYLIIFQICKIYYLLATENDNVFIYFFASLSVQFILFFIYVLPTFCDAGLVVVVAVGGGVGWRWWVWVEEPDRPSWGVRVSVSRVELSIAPWPLAVAILHRPMGSTDDITV